MIEDDYAQVLEEYVSGEATVRYVHGLDLISQEGEGQQFVYLVDGLGSTRVLTDEVGGVINTYTYEAFGELLHSTGTVGNKYRFAGEQFDENLEQYYLRARFYDPSLGRFTRRDSYGGHIFEPITLHKYLYGNANPVNLIDPTGLYSQAFGYAAEDKIQQDYQNTFPSSNVTFSSTAKVGLWKNIKPDILDHTRRRYNEIKPLSIDGIDAGFHQIKERMISLEKYTREVIWRAPPLIGATTVMGRVTYYVNVWGIIFYDAHPAHHNALTAINWNSATTEAQIKQQLRNVVNIPSPLADPISKAPINDLLFHVTGASIGLGILGGYLAQIAPSLLAQTSLAAFIRR